MQYSVFVFYIIYAVAYDWIHNNCYKKKKFIYVWNEAIYYKFYMRTELKNK